MKSNQTDKHNRDTETVRRDLGLYIHIPFCVKKCDYCDFLSGPATEETKKRYLEALITEIKSYNGKTEEYLVQTIFFGGGTPSSVDSSYINDIMCVLKEVFIIKGVNDKTNKVNDKVNKSKELIQINEVNENVVNENVVNENVVNRNDVNENDIIHDKFNHQEKKSNRMNNENVISSSNNSLDIAEITIEINPGTITRDKLEVYKSVGINRLSFGLQSTDNNELKLLGRIHTYEQFVDNYKLAREVGFKNINIDLMSALPGQNCNSWKETLKKVVEMNPEHISAYSLIIEEETPFYEQYGNKNSDDNKLLPNEETDRFLYTFTKDYLKRNGYQRYEISNYAKEGYASRHNCSYWIGTEYLGLGLGASSYLQHTRFHNLNNLDDYIKLCNRYDEAEGNELLNTITQNLNNRIVEEKNIENKYMKEKSIKEIYINEDNNEENIKVGNSKEDNSKEDNSKEDNNKEENNIVLEQKNIMRDHIEIRREVEVLTPKDQMEEFMFLGLRMSDGISKDIFHMKFDQKIEQVYGDIIEQLKEEELIIIDGNRIYLTDYGIDVSNTVLAKFLIE